MGKSGIKKLCFVVGPIGANDSEIRVHADWLLEEIIQPVMAEFADFEVKRADQDHRPGLIDAQLISDLLNAELVIPDLSSLNPNAFYEIGIRHMAQKPIIHMQIVGEQIPFDVSLYRSIKFSRRKPSDIREARAALKAQVKVAISTEHEVENPVTNARGQIQLGEHATAAQKVLLDQIEALGLRLDNLEDRDSAYDERTGSERAFLANLPENHALFRLELIRSDNLVRLIGTVRHAVRNRFSDSHTQPSKGGRELLVSIPRSEARAFADAAGSWKSVRNFEELIPF
jgi:hypothetical protein